VPPSSLRAPIPRRVRSGWLWRTVGAEGTAITEVEVSERLRAFRAAQPGFLDVSFPTIAGSGANGAIIHYNCEAVAKSTGTSGVVDRCRSGARIAGRAGGHALCGSRLLAPCRGSAKMLLIDSGGQYDVGTTDVTRTIHLGQPTAWQRGGSEARGPSRPRRQTPCAGAPQACLSVCPAS
jgi:Xaa-Pro aminopeptidase